MSFSINTNIASLQAQNYLTQSSSFQSQTIGEVTSGLRIVNSGDDAAGLAVANGLASAEAVLNQGVQNAQNGLATLQTIDGGMGNINTLLDRAQTLATESASGTFSGSRATLNAEFQSVLTEINRQSQSIGLNTGGAFNASLAVYIGGGRGSSSAAQTADGTIGIDLSRAAVDSQSLGLQGLQAAGVSATNLANSSATSVANLLADATNKASEAVAGSTIFTFRGAGFSDASGVSVSVNLNGVTDVNSLAAAVNNAIQTAGNGGTSAATAFKNANIVANVTTDASGNQAIAFSSSNTAFQVQAGDQMANAIMGNFNNQATLAGTAALATVDTSSNNTIAIKFNGATTATTYTLDSYASKAGTSLATIAADLNSQAAFNSLATAYVDSAGHFIIQSKMTGTSSSVNVTSTTGLASTLGIANTSASISDAIAGQTLAGTVTGAANTATAAPSAAGNVMVRFQGSGLANPVDINVSYAASASVQSILNTLQTDVANNSALQAAGIKMAAPTAGSKLSFSNSSNQLFSVEVAGDTGNLLGMGTWQLANPSTATSMDYTSITGGSATTAGAADLQFSIAGGAMVDLGAVTLAGGSANATADAAALNAALATNSTLAAAGITASINGSGKLTLSSSNGTSFRVNDTTAFSGINSSAGTASAGSLLSTLTPEANTFNSGGAQTTQTLSFSPILNGSDTQTISLSAEDANGTAHTTSLVLQNNATARNAGSIDAAVAAINKQLQQTNDSTLQGIVAVSQNVNGQQEIQFLGTRAFQISSGTTASGAGLGSQGTVVSSALSSGGGTANISTAAGAQAAINALTSAVAVFGTAQAAVGRGENNLNYAISLAQSEVTNDAAAESTIKDANLATEAANLTKAQILMQAGTAALAQANSAPQTLLTLLQHP